MLILTGFSRHALFASTQVSDRLLFEAGGTGSSATRSLSNDCLCVGNCTGIVRQQSPSRGDD